MEICEIRWVGGLVECNVGCLRASLRGFAISRAENFVLHDIALGFRSYVH